MSPHDTELADMISDEAHDAPNYWYTKRRGFRVKETGDTKKEVPTFDGVDKAVSNAWLVSYSPWFLSWEQKMFTRACICKKMCMRLVYLKSRADA